MKKKLIEKTPPRTTRRDGWYTRLQIVDKYVVFNTYKNKTLKFRHVLNAETHEYATLRDKEWTMEQLAGAFDLNYYKNNYYYSDNFIKAAEEKLRMSSADERTLKETLGKTFEEKYNSRYSKKSILRAIDEMEQDYDRKKRRSAEERRWDRVKTEMDKVPVPDVPALWKWIDNAVTGGKNYMFRTPDKKEKPYEWMCSACGGISSTDTILFFRDKKPFKDGDMVACPHCGEKVKIQTRKRSLNITQPFVIIQNLDDITSVARHLRAKLICDGKAEKRIFIKEEVRLMMYREPYGRRGIRWDLYYDQSYLGAGCWFDSTEWQAGSFDNKSNPCQQKEHTGLLYLEGIEEGLKGTIYEDWTRTFTAAAAKGIQADWNRLMATSYNDGSMLPDIEELMLKGRFYRLFREISEDISLWNYKYIFDDGITSPLGHGGISVDGETIEEIFGINDRQLINRIRDHNGGGMMLEWMRWSERHRQKVSDKCIEWGEKNKVDPSGGAMNWLLCRFSPEQAMNYVERQRKESYKGKSAAQVIEQYADYMNMCEKLKKNTSDEMVYRPRELKRRHDEAVVELEMKKARIETKEYARKYPEAEKVIKKIRTKFEYRGKEYFIMVPRHISDIVIEGRCLHHCAGATDRYFDRIKDHETYICFLRRTDAPDTPFYTIEVEPGGTIRQHRGMYDEEPDIEKVKPFLREWQKVIKSRMDEDDRKKAKASKVKRAENIRELKEKNNTRVLQGLMEDFMDAAAV